MIVQNLKTNRKEPSQESIFLATTFSPLLYREANVILEKYS